MKSTEIPSYSKEEQKMLFSYFDTVLVDFDSLLEMKKIKDQLIKATKKSGNK
jgi:hypothetical protein